MLLIPLRTVWGRYKSHGAAHEYFLYRLAVIPLTAAFLLPTSIYNNSGQSAIALATADSAAMAEGYLTKTRYFTILPVHYIHKSSILNNPSGPALAGAISPHPPTGGGENYKEYTIMGVPKKHKTRSGRDQRRSHHALKAVSFATCKNCGQATMPHLPCKNCGYYKGRKITK